jgi:DNA invertase Pin-like site-specific DNA recombinase
MLFGYGRVSTAGQDLAAQIAELKAAGCTKVYSEKVSGARGDRAELAKLMKRLQPGDVLVVTRLDRLARSTRDLLNVLDTVKQAGAGFRSLKDSWADTTTPHGQLMLTILGGLAEFGRSLIVARTGEGRERAKARGAMLCAAASVGSANVDSALRVSAIAARRINDGVVLAMSVAPSAPTIIIKILKRFGLI